MPYPVQTFPDFASLLAYMNNEWVTNGNGDIDAVIGNNVVNGLLTFIEQSPLNYQAALVTAAGGAITASRPITVFITTTPTSLQWGNNIYNQFVFINTTNTPIPLGGGQKYYDINLTAQSSIPAKTVLSIVKATNGLWISNYNAGGNSSTLSFVPLQFRIGDDDSPMNAGDTVLVITVDNAINDSELIILDGSTLYRNLDDRISYDIDYTSTEITITFNQGVADRQVYLIKYSTI